MTAWLSTWLSNRDRDDFGPLTGAVFVSNNCCLGAESNRLHRCLELGAQAAGADVQPYRLTVDDERPLLHVRLEGAIRLRGLAFPAPRVLVSDIAAESGTLTADVTSSHLAYLYRPYGRVRMQRKE